MEGLGQGLKRTERKWGTRLANGFVMVEVLEARLFWREVDSRLAACIREEEVDRILHYLHCHGPGPDPGRAMHVVFVGLLEVR